MLRNILLLNLQMIFAPVYSTVKVETSNSLIAEVKSDLTAYLDSDIDRCEGIGIRGGIEGTCTVTVTVSGVNKNAESYSR